MTNANANLSKELIRLQDAYLKALPDKLSKIRESWQGILNICEMMQSDSDTTTENLECSYPWNRTELINLQRLVHNLSGSGLTFGFKAISEAAHTLDIFLQAVIQKSHPPNAEQSHQITNLIECLEKAPLPTFSANPSTPSSSMLTEQRHDTSIARHTPEEKTQEHHIFLLEENFEEGEILGFQLNSFGYKVSTFQSLSKLQEALSKTLPDIILMNIDFLNGYT